MTPPGASYQLLAARRACAWYLCARRVGAFLLMPLGSIVIRFAGARNNIGGCRVVVGLLHASVAERRQGAAVAVSWCSVTVKQGAQCAGDFRR